MKAGIFSGADADRPDAELLAEVLAQPSMEGLQLAEEVSVDEAYVVEPAAHGWEGEPMFTIAALDLGIKAMTPQRFAERGVRVHVLPAATTFEEAQALNPDGVFLSNGPGDPATADAQVAFAAQLPRRRTCRTSASASATRSWAAPWALAPTSCATATAASTSPSWTAAPARWRSPARTTASPLTHPWTGPSQAPEERFGRVEVSHISLNDQVVEGLACLDIPAFSVQYHPEAAAGPHDAAYLFDRFIDLMTASTAHAQSQENK